MTAMGIMNDMPFVQNGNCFVVCLPNCVPVIKFIVPCDGQQSLNFNTLDGITTLVAKRAGLLDIETKQLRKLKVPKDIRITHFNGNYSIYLKNMKICEVALDNDVISSKIVVGIAVILFNRWKRYMDNFQNGYDITNGNIFK